MSEQTSNELVKYLSKTELDNNRRSEMLTAFQSYFETATKLRREAEQIIVTDASQVAEMKKARELRLALRDVRTDSQKAHDLMKKESIEVGRALDGLNNIVIAIVKPAERYLDNQEKFIEIRLIPPLSKADAADTYLTIVHLPSKRQDNQIVLLPTAADAEKKFRTFEADQQMYLEFPSHASRFVWP